MSLLLVKYIFSHPRVCNGAEPNFLNSTLCWHMIYRFMSQFWWTGIVFCLSDNAVDPWHWWKVSRLFSNGIFIFCVAPYIYVEVDEFSTLPTTSSWSRTKPVLMHRTTIPVISILFTYIYLFGAWRFPSEEQDARWFENCGLCRLVATSLNLSPTVLNSSWTCANVRMLKSSILNKT
jgi:hypothetical protein